jgi:SAM-dependent methyltransferase
MNQQEYHRMFEEEEQHWWFQGRRTVVFGLLEKLLRKKQQRQILDFGCGTGLNTLHLQQWGRVVSMDTSLEAKKFCTQRGIRVLTQDIRQAQQRYKEQFDVVVALDVLEHIPHDKEALQALYTVLKPNGLLVLTVPAHPYLWSSHDEALHHQRRYTKKELQKKLQQSKFHLLTFSYYHLFIYPLALLRALINPKGSSTSKTTAPVSLRKLYRVERWLIERKLALFGTSLICIARK